MDDIELLQRDLRDGNIEPQRIHQILLDLQCQVQLAGQRLCELQRQIAMVEDYLQANQPDLAEPSSPTPHPSRVGRNQTCPCGSGKKYKKCCLASP